MTSKQDLEDLRAQIDAVDDGLHDLLMKRAGLQQRISAAKGGGVIIRPAREAQILRRLFAHHKGEPSFAVVAHLLREIIAASVRMQGRLEVAVYGGENPTAIWDMARQHYGTITDFRACASAREAVDAVKSNPGTIGVIAIDDIALEDGVQEPWWSRFAEESGAGLHIAAGLPFFSAGKTPTALAIAHCEQEPSGQDTTLVALRTDGSDPRGAAGVILASAAGFALAAVPGYVTCEDAAVQEWLSEPGVVGGTVIGQFANPIELGQKP